jgi:carboxylesterase type B
VTLFGQSAGSASTSAHLVMPKSNGLFTRAIMESGPWADWTARTWAQSANHTDRVAGSLKCAGTDAEVIACLRQATWQEIVAHQDKVTKIGA